MSDGDHGVGVNGEPDDFAARYDRMVADGPAAWAVKTAFAIVGVLALVVVIRSLITG